MKVVYGLAVAAVMCGGVGRGELIVERDGTVVEGRVTGRTEKEVVVETETGGEKGVVRVPVERVARVVVTDGSGAEVAEGAGGGVPEKRAVRKWEVPAEPVAPAIGERVEGTTYCVIPLHGGVGETVTAGALEKALADAVLRKPTVVVLDIDSPGGQVAEAEQLLKVLHAYNSKLRIIAFVDQDLSAAAIVSLSVRDIFVKPSSTIGAATAYNPSNLQMSEKVEEKMQSAWRAVARSSAQEGHHEPLLAQAMIDGNVELHLETVEGKKVVKEGPGEETLCHKGKILTLSSREAVACGLAEGVAENMEDLGRVIGFEGWKEIKGLGTALGEYLPQRWEAFNGEKIKLDVALKESFEEAKRADPTEETVTRTVVTQPGLMQVTPLRPMVPQIVRPGQIYVPQPMIQQRVVVPQVVTQEVRVSTPETRAAWNERSLKAVAALQRMEQIFGEEIGLSEAFGQRGTAEAMKEGLVEIGAVRALIYANRGKVCRGEGGGGGHGERIRDGYCADSDGAEWWGRWGRFARGDEEDRAGRRAGGGPFVRMAEGNRPMVGVRYTMGAWGGHPILRQVDPLYERTVKDDEKKGEVVVAKEDYVVGGMIVDSDSCVNAVKLVFVRVKEGKMNLADQYTSEWLGYNVLPVHQTTMAGNGEKVVGLFGRQGLNTDAIGLVVVGEAERAAGKPALVAVKAVGRDGDLPKGAERTQELGGNGGLAFVRVGAGNQLMIGIHYTTGEWRGHPIIGRAEPVYERVAEKGPKDGKTVVAKEGYIVGGMMVDSDVCVNAVKLVFFRMKDGRVDTTDQYTSDWLGYNVFPVHQNMLGGNGEKVIGLFGRQGANADAIGLVVMKKEE